MQWRAGVALGRVCALNLALAMQARKLGMGALACERCRAQFASFSALCLNQLTGILCHSSFRQQHGTLKALQATQK